MMLNKKLVLVVAAAVAVAGCAKKRPEVLPPAAGDTVPPPAADPGTGTTTGVVPGSAEDFRQSVMSDTVNFALDQYDLDSQARSILDSQARWLAQYPNVRVSIEGHADERGTREYNLALGERRANSVSNYLAARGVSPSRITTVSYGKERPIALGSDEESWARNRRAATVILQ